MQENVVMNKYDGARIEYRSQWLAIVLHRSKNPVSPSYAVLCDIMNQCRLVARRQEVATEIRGQAAAGRNSTHTDIDPGVRVKERHH